MSLMVEQPGICISVYRSLFSASSALEFLERLELAIADEWDYPELLWKNSGVGSNNQISSHRTSISCPLISLSKPYPQTELSEFFKQEIDDKIHVAMIDYATENMLSTGMREPYSVLKYFPGAEYHAHYDHSPQTGRVFSMVASLSEADEGGELEFPKFDITLKLSPGDVVFFPSNFPYLHIAHPVVVGFKHSIVTWYV